MTTDVVPETGAQLADGLVLAGAGALEREAVAVNRVEPLRSSWCEAEGGHGGGTSRAIT